MPVNSTHPQYDQIAGDWQAMDDALAKGSAIKDAGTRYLPKTSGMREAEVAANGEEAMLTPQQARELYQAYKDRAVYPLWVKDGLRTMMGLLSRQELEINLPDRLAVLEESATSDGFSTKQLWLRVCAALLSKGRAPIVGDIDDNGLPYVAEYTAQSGINWRVVSTEGRADLVLAVFTEQRATDSADEYSHDTETVYRVFSLIDGMAVVQLLREDGSEIEANFIGTESPGNTQPLKFLPVVYAGTTDSNPDVDEIPLLSMAQEALKYYQISADYYTSLHYTSHPQPVVQGLSDDAELRVTGPMAAWMLPSEGSAYYLEFTGAGIEANRKAMTDRRDAALEAGAKVMDVGAESGEARKTRQDDQHMTLYGVAKQAAAALNQMYRYLAEWIGANPDDVEIEVEPKFSRQELDAAMLQIVSNMRLAGEVPRQVVYEAMRKAQVTELTDEQLDALNEGGDLPNDEDAE